MEAEDLKPLSKEKIEKNLKDLPGWQYSNDRISKQFECSSFNDALKLVNNLAPYCNKIDHHPDIYISYKKVRFELTRFSVGGKVTMRDFTVAREIERLYNQYQK